MLRPFYLSIFDHSMFVLISFFETDFHDEYAEKMEAIKAENKVKADEKVSGRVRRTESKSKIKSKVQK